VIVALAFPVLEIVKACGDDDDPTVMLPKSKEVGAMETIGAGATPVPLRLDVAVRESGVSVTVNVVARLPAAVGVKVTLRVQLELALSVNGGVAQVPPLAGKSPVSPPTKVIELTVPEEVPVLEIVKVCAEELEPTVTLPKLNEVGVTAMTGPETRAL
jgi:hypothetical protein